MSSGLHSIPIVARRPSSSSSVNLVAEDGYNTNTRRSPSLRSYKDSDEELEIVDGYSPICGTSSNIQTQPTPTIVFNHPLCQQTHLMMDKMRRRLRFFFMNPLEKWQAKHRFPWKLLLQLIKIIIVTLQVALFGSASYSHISFYNDNMLSLSHLFLRNWDETRDVNSYPPAQGPLAAYTTSDFYDAIDYAVINYAQLRNLSVGSYDYSQENGTIGPVKFCKYFFKECKAFGFNESYTFDSTILEECLDVSPLSLTNSSAWSNFSSESYFEANNFGIEFLSLVQAELKFSLKSVLLNDQQAPDCFRLDLKILFDNRNRAGQIKISLQLLQVFQNCHGTTNFYDSKSTKEGLLCFLDIVVMTVCFLSFILCFRAIVRAQKLKRMTINFFEKYFDKNLTLNEKLEFLNCWYVMIVVNDVLIIVASVIKIQIENKSTEEDLYNACSVMLGVGTLLVWFGVLRYLKLFPKYNILILTVQRAAPDVLRFLLCAMLVYAGFVFNGWIILGPYHVKFRTITSTSECLFSLINGDDMYSSFAITSDKSDLIWWYSRIYFYSFISLFIYIVLSLFIAVIMDAYDTIKNFHQQDYPKSDLMAFISECVDEASSGLYRERSETTKWTDFFKTYMCGCCSRRHGFTAYEPI